MNLTLSRRADYAVRAAICLAGAWDTGSSRKLREITSAMDLPSGYTPQIMGILVRAGLVEAKAGRAGGYRLSRPPARISLLEVVEAAEGELIAERCTLSGGPCHWDDVCAVHPSWERATAALRASLSRARLSEIAATESALSQGQRVPGRRHPKRRTTARSNPRN